MPAAIMCASLHPLDARGRPFNPDSMSRGVGLVQGGATRATHIKPRQDGRSGPLLANLDRIDVAEHWKAKGAKPGRFAPWVCNTSGHGYNPRNRMPPLVRGTESQGKTLGRTYAPNSCGGRWSFAPPAVQWKGGPLTTPTKPVVVTVEPQPVTVTQFWVHCTACGPVGYYKSDRDAAQWAQHHRMVSHPAEYRAANAT
jgi:hypothetical protein